METIDEKPRAVPVLSGVIGGAVLLAAALGLLLIGKAYGETRYGEGFLHGRASLQCEKEGGTWMANPKRPGEIAGGGVLHCRDRNGAWYTPATPDFRSRYREPL